MEAMSGRNRHCARCELLSNMQFKLMPCEAEMALLILLCHPVSVESKHNESTLAMDVVNPMQSTCRLPAASSKSSEVSSSVH